MIATGAAAAPAQRAEEERRRRRRSPALVRPRWHFPNTPVSAVEAAARRRMRDEEIRRRRLRQNIRPITNLLYIELIQDTTTTDELEWSLRLLRVISDMLSQGHRRRIGFEPAEVSSSPESAAR